MSAHSTSYITVLFIDDNPQDLYRWSAAIRASSKSYRVLEATNGLAGLDLFRHEKVDCVVLDLDMPQVHGFELLFDFVPNRKSSKTAVVVLTRLPYSDLHDLVKHHGAHACLVKQHTSVQDLDRAIRSAVALASSK
jgi:DNA-binding NarL/FixJ family response regulator